MAKPQSEHKGEDQSKPKGPTGLYLVEQKVYESVHLFSPAGAEKDLLLTWAKILDRMCKQFEADPTRQECVAQLTKGDADTCGVYPITISTVQRKDWATYMMDL